MTRWTSICHVDDIPMLGARRVARPKGLPVALFRTADGDVSALLDRCPHKAGPLSQGIVHGRGVSCPLHNWVIGLDDGCARAPDAGSVPVFACRVDEAGHVFLDADELEGLALELSGPVAGPCGR